MSVSEAETVKRVSQESLFVSHSHRMCRRDGWERMYILSCPCMQHAPPIALNVSRGVNGLAEDARRTIAPVPMPTLASAQSAL